MGRPAGRNRQKTEMILYAGHIHRFQAEAGKTNPVTRSAVADTPLSAHPATAPQKTGYPSPVPPTRQSSPAGLPPAGGFPAMNRTSPPRFPSRCFPESAPFPSPVPFPGDGANSRTGNGMYRISPVSPFSLFIPVFVPSPLSGTRRDVSCRYSVRPACPFCAMPFSFRCLPAVLSVLSCLASGTVQARQAGYAPAMNVPASHDETANRPEDALRRLEKSAAKHDPESQYRLAGILLSREKIRRKRRKGRWS